MSEEQQFCLRWNNFQANITSQFEALRDEEDFVDVTLACDGQRLKAHKVVLSACSPYFKELFRSNPCKHPILFLRDVSFHHLRALVEFMYAGEVNVAQAQLSAFLRTAESLQIRGLTEAPQKHKQLHMRQHHQQQQQPPAPSLPSELTATVGLDSSSAAEEIVSSPECVGIDEDDEALSLSPRGGSSPNPAKRQCLQQDGGDAVQQRTHTSTSLSHTSDLRQELETVIKDNPADIVEPKLELPDYSDGESKVDTVTCLGLDSNSVDVNAPFTEAFHEGAVDILPGPSNQSFLGEPTASLDSGQVDHRKLHSLDPRPCPICNRMYSNLSNLRQHVRLIHNPQTVACPLCSKPFKTKLYLKRHLTSYHEILCGSEDGSHGGSKQGSEFYPPPPQVFLDPPSSGEEEESKTNLESISKGKYQKNPLEIFNVSQSNVVHNPSLHCNHQEKSRMHTGNKNKDSQPDIYHHRSFLNTQQHGTGHEDKSGFHNSVMNKQASSTMDLFHMPRIFHCVMSSSPVQVNQEDKNFLSSGTSLQFHKMKDNQHMTRNFQSDEDKSGYHLKNIDTQGHNSDCFQSSKRVSSGSQSQTSSEEIANNYFQVPSSLHTKHKDLSHSDLYNTGRNYNSNSEDRNIYSSSSGDKEGSTQAYISSNHKEEQN